LQAYVAGRRRALAARPYRPKPRKLFTVQEALDRLTKLVGALPSWSELRAFLPEGFDDPVEQRAALASTLVAGLEMARGGGIELQQEAAFGPIMIRRRTEEGDSDGRTG
jgi:segregation and condensation protein A